MSGLTDRSGESRPSETPRALADLAASLADARPSESVARALAEAWEARAGAPAPAAATQASASPPVPLVSRRRLSARRWVGLAGAAAAMVVAASALFMWRGGAAPDGDAAVPVPASVLEPPPDRALRPADAIALPPAPAAVVAAVPDGPLAPPPGTLPHPTPEPPRRTTRGEVRPTGRPATAPPAAEGMLAEARPVAASAEDGEAPFIWLRGADQLEPGLGVQVVRVRLPRVGWDTGSPRPVLVEADLLMGFDGQPRAVRMVRTSTR